MGVWALVFGTVADTMACQSMHGQPHIRGSVCESPREALSATMPCSCPFYPFPVCLPGSGAFAKSGQCAHHRVLQLLECLAVLQQLLEGTQQCVP